MQLICSVLLTEALAEVRGLRRPCQQRWGERGTVDVRCHLEGSLTLAVTSENTCVLLPPLKTCVPCHRAVISHGEKLEILTCLLRGAMTSPMSQLWIHVQQQNEFGDPWMPLEEDFKERFCVGRKSSCRRMDTACDWPKNSHLKNAYFCGGTHFCGVTCL